MLITDTRVWLGDGSIQSEIRTWLRAYGETSQVMLVVVCEARHRQVLRALQQLERAGHIEQRDRYQPTPLGHRRWRLAQATN